MGVGHVSVGHVHVKIKVDVSEFLAAVDRAATAAFHYPHHAAVEFEEAMSRIEALTRGTGADVAEAQQQVIELSRASALTLRQATDYLLVIPSPSGVVDVWPTWTIYGPVDWPEHLRRSRMHRAYRAKTRRRNRR